MPLALIFSEERKVEEDNLQSTVLSGSSTFFTPAAEKFLKNAKIDKKIFEGMGLVNTKIIEQQLRYKKLRKAPIAGIKFMEAKALHVGNSHGLNSTLTIQLNGENIYKYLEDKKNYGVSLLPIIIREAAGILKKYPNFTAFYKENAVYFYDEVSIGVSLDTGSGLKVVTLTESNLSEVSKIYEKLVDFSMRDMRGELTDADVTGSTFTITDLSAYNILNFRPLINGEQSAILGIGGDKTISGMPITLTVTFDHRVMSGKEVAEFLNELRQKILNYAL